MKLVVLGSGSSVPHPRRTTSSYWLQTHTGSLLLDMGIDAAHRMAQEGLDWPNLDAVWISHFHLDHFGGLAAFLFSVRWAPQTQNRRKPLKIYGPNGLVRVIKAMNDANNYRLLEQTFPVDLVEVDPGTEFEILTGLAATTLSTPHTKESLALRLTTESGLAVIYTSDTGFSDELINFARKARVLLLECSFRRNKPLQAHLELADAMRIVGECRPQTVVLTHLYPEWDDANVVAEAKRLWSGEVLEAVDGLRLELEIES